MHQQDALDRPSHPDLLELVAHSLESGGHGGIFFEQWLFCTESVVCQWIPEIDYFQLHFTPRAKHLRYSQVDCSV
jgi:hypothetical protein